MRVYVDPKITPGVGALLVCISDDRQFFKADFVPDPIITNNRAEYLAVILAAENVPSGSVIFTDSRLVVKQISGEYKIYVKELLDLYNRLKKLIEEKKLTVLWIPREENLAGLIV